MFVYSIEDDKTNNLRSLNRKLDQNLLLIVQQKNTQSDKDEWIFPEKIYEGEISLRAVSNSHRIYFNYSYLIFKAAERLISTCGNLHVQIAGNAPLAFYKNEKDPASKKV